MKWPRARFTVRRAMVAVAVAALLIWTTSAALRWAEYRRMALHHEDLCQVLASELETFREQERDDRAKGRPDRPGLEEAIEVRARALADEGNRGRIYRRSMRSPWRRARLPSY